MDKVSFDTIQNLLNQQEQQKQLEERKAAFIVSGSVSSFDKVLDRLKWAVPILKEEHKIEITFQYSQDVPTLKLGNSNSTYRARFQNNRISIERSHSRGTDSVDFLPKVVEQSHDETEEVCLTIVWSQGQNDFSPEELADSVLFDFLRAEFIIVRSL